MSDPPKTIDHEDVDDVIGVAAELAQVEEDQISVAEVEDVARQLDIPDHHVRPAVEELKRQRTEARQASRVKRVMTAVVVVLPMLWGLTLRASLSKRNAHVIQANSQWRNVVERQVAVRARYDKAPASPERDAELDGAENRVRIERRRYDDAATDYNIAAKGLMAKVVLSLTDLPARSPLSDEEGAN